MSTLDYARAYAARGWSVFVLSGQKVPLANCGPCRAAGADHDREACPCLTCHGFYAATRDRTRITQMFERYPHNPVAIRTGAPSRLVVVEVDPKNGGIESLIALDRRAMLPGTLMVESGGGSDEIGGIHFYYAHPGGYVQSGADRLGRGVDVKADGGYVVAPPSVHRSGRIYCWSGNGRFDDDLTPLHPDVLAILRPPAPTRAMFERTAKPSGAGRFRGALRALAEAPEGKRNDVLLWAAAVAGEMIAAGEMGEADAVADLQETALSIGLSRSEIGDDRKGTIGSGLRRGQGKVAV